MLCMLHIFSLLFLLKYSSCDDSLLISTEQGQVRGYKNVETDLYEFYGIPYATVPKGQDKFKAPLPPVNRDYILEANIDVYCPQNLVRLPGQYMEDCLIVNIFVPDTNLTKYSVVIYIHGGSFENGFGSWRVPRSIAQEGVIGVTVNYRLGAHGFLCLRTENVPGNAGLKDQLAAIRWVKNNIENFGGDPNDITLAGFSAGGATAEILMLSPTNTNLFQKIILESGYGVASFAIKEEPTEFAQTVAIQLGASDSQAANVNSLEEFYLNLTFEQMFSPDFSDVPSAGFCPCIENKIGNIETIIEEDPLHILINGTFNKLPVLTGFTNGEGIMFHVNRDKWLSEMVEHFPDFFPPNFYLKDHELEKEAVRNITNLYFPNGFAHENVDQNYVDYFTDSVFVYFGLLSARAHAGFSQKVYLYEFTYTGTLDLYNRPHLGAGHCAQTAHVLNDRLSNVTLNENDQLIRDRVVKMWANFIKYTEPIPESTELLPVAWSPLQDNTMNYLQINLKMENMFWPREMYMKFWDDLWHIKRESNSNSYRTAPQLFLILSICLYILYSFKSN